MKRSLRDFCELTKPRIVTLAILTLALGYGIGAGETGSWLTLCAAVGGAALVAAGASVLNHYLERDVDGLMARTRNRPLPRGRVRPMHALAFGLHLIFAGLALLLWRVNVLTAFLLLLSAFLYVLVYTPMKRVTWWNTTVGAIPGAIPPLAGWTSATGSLGAEGWILFAILFVWQHAHFFAIAWMYRDDYRGAGFRMLSESDVDGRRCGRAVWLWSLILLPVSLLPVLWGFAPSWFGAWALLLGLGMAFAAFQMLRERTFERARTVLRVSVLYLPALLAGMVGGAVR